MSLARYRERLDPGMLAYAERFAVAPGGPRPDPETQRAAYREHAHAIRAAAPAGVVTRDFAVRGPAGEIACREYRPPGDASATTLYLHGGGWVVGDLDTHDDVCAELAAGSGTRVVAVDYRLAPEHPYPAAFDDCRAVLDHLRGVAAGRFVVCGDSAGANLAAALALSVRDTGAPPLAGQVLIYPLLCPDCSLPAYRELHDAPLLSAADVEYFLAAYFGTRAPDAYAAPLLADDFSGLAPAVVVAAACDPLRDDARDYARRLRAAGTPCELHVADGLLHAFVRARHESRAAAEAFARAVAAVAGFARPPA